MQDLEKKLDEVFVKNSPVQLPKGFKDWLVKYGPIIGLVFGIIGLFTALGLWKTAHTVNVLVDSVNELSRLYGTGETVDKLNLWFYLAFASILVQSIIAIVAYPGLKERSKARGWNLLFYSQLIGIVCGLFSSIYYGNLFNFVTYLIGVVIGLFFVFQIRSYYNGHSESAKSEKTEKSSK